MIENAIVFATSDVKDDRMWCSARRWKLQFLTVSHMLIKQIWWRTLRDLCLTLA